MKATELLYLDDIDRFLELGQQMQAECEPDLPYDDMEARSNVWACLQDTSRSELNVWIVRHEGEIVGFGVGRIGKYLFSTAKIGSLLLWYVLPQHRKSRAAFEILHNFENWCKLQDVTRIEVGAAKVGVEDADNLNRMFTKRGFRRYGELFFRDRKG